MCATLILLASAQMLYAQAFVEFVWNAVTGVAASKP
jgi:hypothetical protein